MLMSLLLSLLLWLWFRVSGVLGVDAAVAVAVAVVVFITVNHSWEKKRKLSTGKTVFLARYHTLTTMNNYIIQLIA